MFAQPCQVHCVDFLMTGSDDGGETVLKQITQSSSVSERTRGLLTEYIFGGFGYSRVDGRGV